MPVQVLRVLRDPIGVFREEQKRYGDIFAMSLPFYGRVVILAEPGLVKSIFTAEPALYNAGEPNKTVLEPVLGANSLLTLDGEQHMHQRKLLLPPFHGKRIETYGELARTITRQEMERWPVSKPFALHKHTQTIAVALILKAVFGVHDEDRLQKATLLIEQNAERAHLVSFVPTLRRNLGRWSPWSRFLRSREALDEFIYEEIALRRAQVAAGEKHDDVLSLLLEARYDDGTPMSDVELRDQLMTILGAGNETTANGLAWGMERLLRTPRALSKLRESLAAGEEDYLAATVKETLRMRPALPSVIRKLNAPVRIGDFDLEAGVFVLPSIAALHYREDLFPEPDEFRPERFLEEKADNYAWIPFGGGVRRCIGATFAEYEMRTILREIILRANLVAPDPEPERVKLAAGALLTPGKGVKVVLTRPLH